MQTLDRKLLRDLKTLWSQALTIALVVASGIAGFLTCLSATDSLLQARDEAYAEGHFADVFVNVRRAPLDVAERLRELPGVGDVQATITHLARIHLEGSEDPILGQLIGWDPRQGPRLNRVSLVAGRSLSVDGVSGAPGGQAIEALVSRGFSQARGLVPGDHVSALINGRLRKLHIVGIAVSPEYVFAGLFGMPDRHGFGVFWVDQQVLEAACDLRGAFNTLAVRLTPQAARQVSDVEVAQNVTKALARFGSAPARTRRDQISHMMLENEIHEQRVLGTVLPSIFFAVAAFLLNVVVSRLIATQREQIATLKALGYPDHRIATHYLKLVLSIALLGLAIGVALGDWLGARFVDLYADLFAFRRFVHVLEPSRVVLAAVLSLATAVIGTLSAIVAIVRLTPAQAMRPPAPGRFRRTLLERLGLRGLSPAVRMILRNMERRPVRTALSIAGIAASLGIVITGNFLRDAIESIVETGFTLSMRSDVSLWLADPATETAAQELARLPGVVAIQALRDVPVLLASDQREVRAMLRALPEPSELFRIMDVDARHAVPKGEGLLLTDRLAAKLGVRVGDAVRVQVLQGDLREFPLRVDATVREMMGLNAYMRKPPLHRALGETDIASGFALSIARGREADFLTAVQGLPRVSGAFSKATLLRNMREMSARNILVMSTVLTLFAAVIAVGVVYNNARIALAERTWELASLRVLGFTRGEVAAILLGEMGVGVALALPLGMLAGYGLVHAIAGLLQSDQFLFPLVIQPRTDAFAALAILVAAAVSALIVRRRIDRLDIVSALKTRE